MRVDDALLMYSLDNSKVFAHDCSHYLGLRNYRKPPHHKETQMLYNKIMSNRQNRNLKIKLEARSSKT